MSGTTDAECPQCGHAFRTPLAEAIVTAVSGLVLLSAVLAGAVVVLVPLVALVFTAVL
jgi:hypothetical protein